MPCSRKMPGVVDRVVVVDQQTGRRGYLVNRPRPAARVVRVFAGVGVRLAAAGVVLVAAGCVLAVVLVSVPPLRTDPGRVDVPVAAPGGADRVDAPPARPTVVREELRAAAFDAAPPAPEREEGRVGRDVQGDDSVETPAPPATPEPPLPVDPRRVLDVVDDVLKSAPTRPPGRAIGWSGHGQRGPGPGHDTPVGPPGA